MAGQRCATWSGRHSNRISLQAARPYHGGRALTTAGGLSGCSGSGPSRPLAKLWASHRVRAPPLQPGGGMLCKRSARRQKASPCANSASSSLPRCNGLSSRHGSSRPMSRWWLRSCGIRPQPQQLPRPQLQQPSQAPASPSHADSPCRLVCSHNCRRHCHSVRL